MDGSILLIAFGAFTVLYIAGWFYIETLSCRRARAGRGTARRPLEPIRLSRASVRSMILTHQFINGPGAYTRRPQRVRHGTAPIIHQPVTLASLRLTF